MGKLLWPPFMSIVFKISLPHLFTEELLKEVLKKRVADRVQLLIQYPRQFVSGPKIPCPTQQTKDLQLNPAKMLRGKFMEHTAA